MSSLLVRVKSKLFIQSRRKAVHLLDGEYGSLIRGRSMDFDDLREYEAGDEVRDIDWKATARHGAPLIKRYRASRRHTVTFVVDTGRNMAAQGLGGESKRDIALLSVGALGFLSVRHGDDVALVYGDGDRVQRIPPASSEAQLERMLRVVHTRPTVTSARSDLPGLLSYVARVFARRMILVIVADETPIDPAIEKLLRRLHVQHDILWVTVRDADLVSDHRAADVPLVDVANGWAIPDFVHGNEDLRAEFAAAARSLESSRASLLDSLEISHISVGSEDDVIPGLLRLLERRMYAR
ncbi:DUF58 domain-containing protein [Klugiella xanthotipulae]|uniref:Uncharacterized protein DUF58 n=1 Tax=Klugiella xanthotipulae TaxID=244735 RepID=A0A543I4J9_9MICO|nr:DUF58 domain-containing protein [Klugiella xanthotipulae]TQM65532.1 uncharacterized protein DUF58 [Klugiella xanthotipulae]